MKKFPLKALVMTTLSIGLLGIGLKMVGAAGSASLSLNPSSGSHDINTTFSVTVYENSGAETVNAVEADLSYDVSKLQFVSIDTSGSAFDIGAVATGGSGSVTIQRGKIGSLTGSQTVGVVTFKALVGSGSTAINFANSSQILRSSDNVNIWNSVTTGGSYTLTTPAAAPPAGSGSSSSSGSASKTSTSTSVAKTQSAPSGAPVASAQTQQANPAAPVPTSRTVSNGSGYLVSIKVTDKDGKPVSNATVTLTGKTATSDSSGMATFTDVSPGIHEVTVKSDKGQVKGDVTVASDQPIAQYQQFTLKVKPARSWLLLVEIGVGVLIVVTLIAFIVKGVRGNKPPTFKVNEPPKDLDKIMPSAPPAQVIQPTQVSSPAVSQSAGGGVIDPTHPS